MNADRAKPRRLVAGHAAGRIGEGVRTQCHFVNLDAGFSLSSRSVSVCAYAH
jgi:hypothetical protein